MKIINTDKLWHFGGGLVITLMFALLTTYLVGLIIGVALAALKEVYDYYHPETHTSDGMDFVATIVGILLAMEIINQVAIL